MCDGYATSFGRKATIARGSNMRTRAYPFRRASFVFCESLFFCLSTTSTRSTRQHSRKRYARTIGRLVVLVGPSPQPKNGSSAFCDDMTLTAQLFECGSSTAPEDGMKGNPKTQHNERCAGDNVSGTTWAHQQHPQALEWSNEETRVEPLPQKEVRTKLE